MTLLGAPGLVLALLLAGCGADTASPSTTAPSTITSTADPTTSPPATATTSPAPSAEDTSWNANGPSFGVDRAEWPGRIKTARLLKSLPKELGNEPRELAVDPRQEGGAGAFYGKVGSVWVATEEHQEGAEKLTAYQHLQAGFGGSSRRADLAWGRSA